jgi:hypothetical protein
MLDECLGLWMPPYGQTGNILWDLSGYNNHATFLGTSPLTWGFHDQFGLTVEGTNNGDQELRLDRTITINTGEPYTIWIHMNRTSTDSIWGGQDGRTSFLVRLGATCYVKTTSNLETLSTDIGTGWMSVVVQRNWSDDVLYVKDGVNFGSEVAHTGIINVQSLVNVTGDDMAIDGAFLGMGIWKRILSRGEIWDLYNNPVMLLEEAPSPLLKAGGGGGGGSVPSPRTNIQGPLVGPLGGPIG